MEKNFEGKDEFKLLNILFHALQMYCILSLLKRSKTCLSTCVNQLMGKVNKERLGEFLGELQRKEDTNDRYVAALKGETLTRNPYVRIQPITSPTTTQADIGKN